MDRKSLLLAFAISCLVLCYSQVSPGVVASAAPERLSSVSSQTSGLGHTEINTLPKLILPMFDSTLLYSNPTTNKTSLSGIVSPEGIQKRNGYSRVSASTIVAAGQGFDTCSNFSVGQAQDWWTNSPYSVVALYIGGSNACNPSQGALAQPLSSQGWKFILTWVGPQAACSGYGSRMSYDTTTAYNQGASEANAAVSAATNAGLTAADGSGTIIYYDLEAYNTSDTSCRNAASSFISGWSAQLRAKGNKAAVYGSSCAAALNDFNSISNVPDAIWPANWYGPGGTVSYTSSATVWSVACIPDGNWANHQRVRQYAGGHYETWGSTQLYIDSDVYDGIVATYVGGGGGGGCPSVSGQVSLWDQTNCSGNSVSANGTGLWDLSSNFNDRAQSIAIPSSWSVTLYKDNSTSSPSVCIPSTSSNLANYHYSDGTSASGSATWMYVYNQNNCPSSGNPPSTPSSPNPSNSATIGRTTDITLSWSTNGTSCDVHIWGGPSLNTTQTGVSCSSFHLGSQWPGTYQWQVTAHNSYGTTSGPTWAFNIQPYAPTSLNASPASQTQINLSWTKSSDDPGSVDNYKVYYSNGTYIATVNAGTINYSVGGLICQNPYSFYVTAVRQGVESPASNTASANTQSCGGPPITPSNPNPTDGGTLGRTSSITLYWSTDGTSCDMSLSGGPGTNINQNGVNCSSFFLGSQWPGSYQWHVTAHNSYGTTTGPTWHFNIQPYAPTSLNASAGSSTQINLSWTKSSDDPGSVDNYKIYYSNSNYVATVNAGTINYSVGSLSCGTPFSFYVTAVRQGVESVASNTATATTNACAANPPTNLHVLTSSITSSSIPLAWDDTSNDETGFKVYRWGWDGSQWTFIYLNSAGASARSYTDPSLTCATTYYYEVTAYNSIGESTPTGWVSGTTLACPGPNPPSNLRVLSGSITSSSIPIAWDDTWNDETGFNIYRWDGATFVYHATVGAGNTTYTDTGLACGTNFYYDVTAYNSLGESAPTNWVMGTTLACLTSNPFRIFLPLVQK